ncbi:hypothetical protein D3C80_1897390 [compost metagenome]
MDVEVGHIAVNGGKNSGALKIKLGSGQLRLSMLIIRQGRMGNIAGVVAVLAGDHQVVHVGAPMCVDLAHFPGGLA